jgi:hypothetical protein
MFVCPHQAPFSFESHESQAVFLALFSPLTLVGPRRPSAHLDAFSDKSKLRDQNMTQPGMLNDQAPYDVCSQPVAAKKPE